MSQCSHSDRPTARSFTALNSFSGIGLTRIVNNINVVGGRDFRDGLSHVFSDCSRVSVILHNLDHRSFTQKSQDATENRLLRFPRIESVFPSTRSGTSGGCRLVVWRRGRIDLQMKQRTMQARWRPQTQKEKRSNTCTQFLRGCSSRAM